MTTLIPALEHPVVINSHFSIVLDASPNTGFKSRLRPIQWYPIPTQLVADDCIAWLDIQLAQAMTDALQNQTGAILSRRIQNDR